MARDIRVHFVGRASDLAASATIDELGLEALGPELQLAGTAASEASVEIDPVLGTLVVLAAALVVVTSPVTVLAATFAGLATGIVGLAAITGNLGDISGKAAVSTEELAQAQQKLTDMQGQAQIAQIKYNDAVRQYGANSVQAQQALVTLHQAQLAAGEAQEKLNAAEAQGHGPIADLIAHVKDMGNALGQQAAPMARQFIELLDKMIPPIQALGSQLITWFGERLPTMLPIFTQIVQGTTVAVLLFGQAWGAMVDWFMAHWQQYIDVLGFIFGSIGDGIRFATPILALTGDVFEQLAPVIGFVRDHADSLKPVLYVVGANLVVMAAVAALQFASLLLIVAAVVAVGAAMSAGVHWVAGVGAGLYRLADWAGQLVGRIPGFAEGGVVPGPIGAPMLAMVHGGERITPAGRRMANFDRPRAANVTIDVDVHPLASPEEAARAVVKAIEAVERRIAAA